MQAYNLTIIIDGYSSASKKKSIREKVEKLIKTLKGKIVEVEDWGKKDLAYKIKKSNSGIYLNFVLELEVEVAKAIDEKLRLEEDVLRYLLVKI